MFEGKSTLGSLFRSKEEFKEKVIRSLRDIRGKVAVQVRIMMVSLSASYKTCLVGISPGAVCVSYDRSKEFL